MEEFCEYNFKYFKDQLPNLRGVPSHDTLNRFFSVLDPSCCEQSNEGHGRREWRECVCCDFERLAKFFLKGWTGVRTLARVTTKRQVGEEPASEETRYYISSLANDPEMILKSVRPHWSIENQLHWRMDVAFREDLTERRTTPPPTSPH